MNANFAKMISLTASALAMTTGASAQQVKMKDNGCPCTPFEQGMHLTNCESFLPAYNLSARPEVKCSWDVFATGSFIYWFASEEGLDIGYNSAISGNTLLPPINGLKVGQKGDWIPGFKVGIGADFDIDKWVGYVEYTWLHGSTTQTLNAGTDSRGTPTIVLANSQRSSFATSTVSSKWHVNLDMLDALLSRPYYEGRFLTINPFFGARALWLRQNFRLALTSSNNSSISHNQSKSWAVGPRAGMQGHWLIGWGFRLEGDAATALLFQRFTKVAHRITEIIRYKNYGVLRPIMDLGLGIGWGSYLDCQNFYLDISANYDFLYLWGQNLMSHLFDDYNYGIDSRAPDLFYQGLTFTVRFDF